MSSSSVCVLRGLGCFILIFSLFKKKRNRKLRNHKKKNKKRKKGKKLKPKHIYILAYVPKITTSQLYSMHTNQTNQTLIQNKFKKTSVLIYLFTYS